MTERSSVSDGNAQSPLVVLEFLWRNTRVVSTVESVDSPTLMNNKGYQIKRWGDKSEVARKKKHSVRFPPQFALQVEESETHSETKRGRKRLYLPFSLLVVTLLKTANS